MKKKLLTTTLLSVSLLSLNLSASGKMNCTGGFCMVDLSKNSSSIKKQEVKKDIYEYEMLLVNNVETIVMPHSKFVMTENEVAEYDLDQMQNNLLIPALNSNHLPNSDYLCEDNLKPIQIVGIANTYECT